MVPNAYVSHVVLIDKYSLYLSLSTIKGFWPFHMSLHFYWSLWYLVIVITVVLQVAWSGSMCLFYSISTLLVNFWCSAYGNKFDYIYLASSKLGHLMHGVCSEFYREWTNLSFLKCSVNSNLWLKCQKSSVKKFLTWNSAKKFLPRS